MCGRSALDEHSSWETRGKQCKDLLAEMLKSRLEAQELVRQGFDLDPIPKPLAAPAAPPSDAAEAAEAGEAGAAAAAAAAAAFASPPEPTDEVILFMLKREAMLTRAKLHFLVYEHLTQEKELRLLKQALRQVRAGRGAGHGAAWAALCGQRLRTTRHASARRYSTAWE